METNRVRRRVGRGLALRQAAERTDLLVDAPALHRGRAKVPAKVVAALIVILARGEWGRG